MLRQSLKMASLASLAGLGAASSCRNDTQLEQCLGIPPCNALREAGLAARIVSPLDAAYEPHVQSWWSANSRLHPYCIVLPQSTDEVSRALTALVGTGDGGAGDWHVAVRSGGHGLPGFSNIDRGVTIDLSMLNGTSYDAESNIASIQPGGRWKDAYAELEEHRVTVAGGRDGGVGVGGFLLGGGISFFSGRRGFGCDSVVNYEVVLADGSVVNANRDDNEDLWRALKGGMSNFGIVTRFDMEAMPSEDMYYNVWFVDGGHSDVVMDAVSAFTDHEVATKDDAMICFFSHDTTVSPDIYVGMIHVNTRGDANTSRVLDEVKALPSMINQVKYQNMAEAAEGSQVEGGSRMASATLTFRHDRDLLDDLVTVHEELVESLKSFLDPSSFLTQMFTQPMPSSMTSAGPRRGGNVLGPDGSEGNLVLWVWGVGVAVDEPEAAFARAHALLMARTAAVREAAGARGLAVDLVYGNYADASQDVVGSYGEENVAFMREVSAKYDATGVFQRRVPGGFKVSRVRE